MNEALERIKDQAGPCGIVCASCPLGSGSVAESAARTKKNIADCQIPMWSPYVPGGESIDWAAVDRGLEWMEKNACCAGCANGGGPPDCTIRICARERGYELCSSCSDLDGCTKFGWLGEKGSALKESLKENRALSREEYIKKMRNKMPW
jgi:hypothetical protein